ncbi:MAG TPA: hypothetical protein VGI46_20300 [Candidatus Acidoferrum sp.]
MSRKLAVVSLAMLVLVGAMSLKTIVTAHGDGSVIMANGAGPAPQTPYINGAGPAPQTPYRNGAGPAPQTPYRNGAGPAPQTPYINGAGPAPQTPYTPR